MRTALFLLALAGGVFLWRARMGKHVPSLEAELKTARAQHAPLVLEFSLTGCQACAIFEDTILASPAVQEASKRVHLVRYNVSEDAAGREAAERLRVNAFPTVVVVGDDGRERTRMEGFPAAPPGVAYFAQFLRQAAEPRF